MNQLPTYNEQFNKITEAYIEGKIKPCDGEFCFCGTLCPYGIQWNTDGKYQDNGMVVYDKPHPYTHSEYKAMETALFDGIRAITNASVWKAHSHPNYENALFNGMCAALEVLKQIHIERGEVIDQPPVFTKRNHPQQLCVKDFGNGVIG